MKNKGRRHKAGSNGKLISICDCKGYLIQITRPIHQMNGRTPHNLRGSNKKLTKRKWQKRMRGYLKSQTKEI